MKLSIIVNMYNTAKYMPRCIDSLICQDIPASDYEIILVDDSSLDDSLAMAMEYQATGYRLQATGASYPTIKVCHHEVNRGLAARRNTGVDTAEGQYLCFVDPDDYIEKNSLAALLKQMDEEQLDMLRFNYQKVDEEYNFVADSPEEATFDYTPGVMTGKDFLTARLGIRCYVWAYVYRTSIIKDNRIRFVEGIYIDDVPWLPKVLAAAKRINCIDVRHQYYLQRGGSLVHTINQQSIQRKVDGGLKLIAVLLKQRELVDKEVRKWYDNQIGHLTFAVSFSAALLKNSDRKRVVNTFRQNGCYPVQINVQKFSAKIRLVLLNICPMAAMWLVNIKNR